MKAPKIFHVTRVRRELELAATAAFEDIASAIAAQNPELDAPSAGAKRSSSLMAQRARSAKGSVIVHHPDRLSHTPCDGDDFMQFVRSLPKGTVISGHSDNSL